MKVFENDKELFEFIRNTDYKNIPSIKDIFSKYDFKIVDFAQFFELFLNNSNILIIDSRSENEFNTTKIFDSINFPILNNYERHNVGLIYKKYSRKAALYLAMEYANKKYESISEFLIKNSAKDKQIIVYCWRGGGRSKFFAKMLIDLGYNPLILEGGIKSFRRAVNDYFSLQEFPVDLIELTGLTGTGKTELLNKVKKEIPVIDLELSARHYSSLFGFIPYKIRNFNPVLNQSSFENNIYNNVIRNERNFESVKYSLIESESKKIGNFYIPDNLYRKMIEAKSIKVNSDIEFRIKRIKRDYFGENNEGYEEITNLFKFKEKYFRKELSNKIYDYLQTQLNILNIDEFIRTMLIEYYDKKYKDKGKKELLMINTNDIEKAETILKDYLNYSYYKH
jgi:tRNA 2-selenouridine synthase